MIADYCATYFSDMKGASDYIKRVLAEIPIDSRFAIIHSVSESECIEESGDWEDIVEIMIDYLRDLDASEGMMIYDDTEGEPCWDFIQSDEHADLMVEAGEGVIILSNDKGKFPVIVIKESFWEKRKSELLKVFDKNCDLIDFTTKISPALYIEVLG